MFRLAVPEDLCSSPELPFDLILLRTGQSGHFGDVPFGRNAVRQAQLRLASSSVLAGNPQLHRLRVHGNARADS